MANNDLKKRSKKDVPQYRALMVNKPCTMEQERLLAAFLRHMGEQGKRALESK